MKNREKVVFSWSGGKDSSLALNRVLQSGNYEIASLITTMTKGYNRISIHGVRQNLLKLQAQNLNLKLETIWIDSKSSNQNYESSFLQSLQKFKDLGIQKIVFGDIFLQDVRDYREKLIQKMGFEGIFPLWGECTKSLSQEFLNLNFKAVTTCVDSFLLKKEFVGRQIDHSFFEDLAKEKVDLCGENGEYHSFVYQAPIFRDKISIQKGETLLRDNRFWYCDFF